MIASSKDVPVSNHEQYHQSADEKYIRSWVGKKPKWEKVIFLIAKIDSDRYSQAG